MRYSRLLSLVALAALYASLFAQTGPWPQERKDRWGTAKATAGPTVHGTPWIANYIGGGYACSHGAALGSLNVGYVGLWNNNLCYRFDTRTGDILGTFDVGSFVTSVPAIPNTSRFYVKGENSSSHIFSVSSKTMDWIWLTPATAYAGSPTIGPDGNLAVVTQDGTAQKLDRTTGGALWAVSGLGSVYTSNGSGGTVVFTRDDANVVVCAGNSVHLLSWADGSTVWEKDLGSQVGQAGCAPNGTIVVGNQAGTIYGLNPADGSVLWQYGTLGAQMAPPAFDGVFVYMGNADSRLYRLDVRTGAKKWSYTTSNSLVGGPVVGADHRVYGYNRNGDFYCLDRQKNLLWTVNTGGEARGPFTLGSDGTLFLARNGDGSQDLGGIIMLRDTPTSASGTIAFSDYVGSVVSSTDLDLRVHGQTTAAVTNAVAVNSDGTFSTSYNMPYVRSGPGAQGQFDLSLKVGTWLRRTVPVDLRTGTVSGVALNLVNGDVVDDNVVDSLDMDAVMTAWHTTAADAAWNPRADLNGDGYVDITDLAIVADNYKVVGDP